MAENETKQKQVTKNGEKSPKLWQTVKTPMTADMIYQAVVKEYPSMFPNGSELVKLIGGDVPMFETQRKVTK